mmetsp:Transcript_15954/g.24045  ORF Transcript_15954/g.24045 Transcript_15954/m.24045 type:complete len:326 (+) Transcript_15954:38-1015(+)
MAAIVARKAGGVKRKHNGVETSQFDIQSHLARFRANTASLPSFNWKRGRLNDTSGRIIGTSTALEKPYRRTSFVVEPCNVRSRSTCCKVLKHLKKRWMDTKDYKYVGEQFKSLRQDLRVQSIRDGLAIETYEVNARICIEVGDFSEFNQCQSQLKELYAIHPKSLNRDEFWSYRILYAMMIHDVSTILAEQTVAKKEGKEMKMVQIALKITFAARSGNYVRFFSLFKECGRHAVLLMQSTKWVVRFRALKVIVKSFAPGKYPVKEIVRVLGFSSELSAIRWLNRCGCSTDSKFVFCQQNTHRQLRRPIVKTKQNSSVTHALIERI